MNSRPPKPIEINNKSKLVEQSRDIQKRAKREVKFGYPRARPFSSPEEINEYLGQDEIECLLCGQRKQSLAAHLSSIHRISSDEYRQRFGLPFGRGLTSKGMTEKLQDVRAKDSTKTRAMRLEKLSTTWNKEKNQRVSGMKSMCAARALHGVTKTPKKYALADAERIIKAMEQDGETFETARHGMSRDTFIRLLSESEDLHARYEAVAGKARRAGMIGNKLWRGA